MRADAERDHSHVPMDHARRVECGFLQSRQLPYSVHSSTMARSVMVSVLFRVLLRSVRQSQDTGAVPTGAGKLSADKLTAI